MVTLKSLPGSNNFSIALAHCTTCEVSAYETPNESLFHHSGLSELTRVLSGKLGNACSFFCQNPGKEENKKCPSRLSSRKTINITVNKILYRHTDCATNFFKLGAESIKLGSISHPYISILCTCKLKSLSNLSGGRRRL